MDINLTIKNYRSFQKPARITLRKGFTSFLGINNSGKSSLLKFFHEFRTIFQSLFTEGNLPNIFAGNGQSFSKASTVLDYDEMFCDRNERDIEIEVDFTVASSYSTLPVPINLNLILRRDRAAWKCKPTVAGHEYISGRHNIIQSGDDLVFEGIVRVNQDEFMSVFRILSDSMYIGAYRNIINVGSNDNYYDIRVGQSFVQEWRARKTGDNRNYFKATNQVTKDIQNIFEFRSLEINPSNDDKTIQVIINERSYKLPEVGAGIAQFIMVLANAAIKRPSYILIDEPELNLHPSLQLDFLTTLASYSTEGVLFATHSMGLALSSSDYVYSVRKANDETSEVNAYETTPHLSEMLGELSYSGYKELGFDKVLLVEGPSEVKVIQQWLRRYKLAHQVVLLQMGGDNTFLASSDVELLEIKRISNNVFALIDSERNSANAPLEPHRQAFVERCQQAGITCKVLDRRATENYFTDRAIKESIGSQFRELAAYESLKDASPKWKKRENWRIAREMTLEEIDSTDLGQFLKFLAR